MNVPFFRPEISEAEINEVVETLRSGWLTTGPRVKRFEEEFSAAVGAPHAIAVNSCTAALHLAVEALGLKQGQAVLVPTMTFAATAEVVRYAGAVPVLVDCDPVTLNMDLDDAERRIAGATEKPVGIIPVHVGGLMMDVDSVSAFAERHGLWVIEDAAHAFPAAWRRPGGTWQRCGEGTSAIACFSFYANKTITTGEGGMATAADPALADRMRMMSLHGLSHDAWGRFSKGGSWDYKILAPGFKYNLTDVAAALGIHQLARAEAMRQDRERLALRYLEALSSTEEIELPPLPDDRIHSWHLFPVKLRLAKLAIDRNSFVAELKEAGVGCSVHWRPLHLHPYYAETFGWKAEDLPAATAVWERILTLPLFPAMTDAEHEHVVAVVQRICERHALGGRNG
ncbi:MAG TPA: DegT/DnrJ/EryC1/StrS family aminotransferase [Thermoanaerobaculia bacterium]|nr:DegT/DnrJ/EryC1/StrS family aminotransferase [Thermoanaerobaculia bacterium]